MKVAAIYGSTNPSCDMLNLYDRSTLIARIHLMFQRRRLMNTVKNDTRGNLTLLSGTSGVAIRHKQEL